MSCEVISRGDLEAYVFGEADPRAARGVEAHLFGCAECATELRQLRSERRLFRARLEAEESVVPTFEDVLARIDGERARPAAFEDVLARIDGERARPAAAVPAFEDVLARVDGERARPAARRAGGGLSARLRAAPVVLAAVAAMGWIWVRGAGAPIATPAALEASGDGSSIVAEPVCEDDGPMSGMDDDKAHGPVSQEPISSVDLSVAGRPVAAVARNQDDTGTCTPGSREACGGGDAQMTYACEDAVAWCAAARP